MVARLVDPAPARPASPSVRRVASTVVVAHAAGALIGAATWLLAARQLPGAVVGVGVALTGVIGWGGLLASGGLGSAVVDLTPDLSPGAARSVTRAAVGRAAVFGAGAGVIATVVLRLVSGPLAVGDRPVIAIALVVGAAATSVAIVGDSVAVAVDRAGLIVGRSLVFAGARVALLGVGLASDLDGRDLLIGGWAAAAALAAIVQLVALGAGPRERAPRPPFGPAAWANHLASLAAQTPALLLPVVLAARSRPTEAAAFGAAWQIASVAALASPAMATAVFAHGRRDPRVAAIAARRARRDLLVVLAPVAVAVVALGPIGLGVLGADYRRDGAVALALVAVALLPDAVSNLAVATWRAHRDYRPAIALNTSMAVVALGGTALLADRLGATGAGLAWLVAQGLGAVVVVATTREMT